MSVLGDRLRCQEDRFPRRAQSHETTDGFSELLLPNWLMKRRLPDKELDLKIAEKISHFLNARGHGQRHCLPAPLRVSVPYFVVMIRRFVCLSRSPRPMLNVEGGMLNHPSR